jgi:integrase
MSPWVFPNSSGTGTISLKSLGKQLSDRQRPADRKLKNRSTQTNSLSLPGGRWTPHDLRRTTATLMARVGVSTDVIEECLNHKIASKVARVYIRDRRTADQVKAFDALGKLLADLNLKAVKTSDESPSERNGGNI